MKVVIVDDTKLNLTLLDHQVRKLPDCESICFTEPIAALEWCLTNEPDLMVVDFNMPVMDGIELTKRFREHYPNIPVLMVTANHDTKVRHDALEIGVNDFLNKPLDNTEFKARSKNMLDLRLHQKDLEQKVRARTKDLRMQWSVSLSRNGRPFSAWPERLNIVTQKRVPILCAWRIIQS